MVVVDAGDSLTGPQVPAPQKELRARMILDAYAKMGVDALGFGERERELGRTPGKARSKIVRRAGLSVGLFWVDLETEKDPAAALREPASALRKQGAQLVIALVHGGLPRVRELVKPGGFGVDVAVTSHTSFGTATSERAGQTWILEAGPQGKQMGRLDLHVLDGKLAFDDVGVRGQLEALLWDQEQQLADLGARQGGALNPQLHDFYERQKTQLQGAMASERQQLSALPIDMRASWLENQQIPLGSEVPDDPDIAALVQRYKAEVAKIKVPPGAAAAPATSGYAGGDACQGCHAPAVAFWQKTKHAQAWQALLKKGQQTDAACVGCHITAGLVGLPNVQCEACHGPAAAHMAQPNLRGLVRRDSTEQQCRSCHTPQQTTEWEYASFRAAILGPGHGGKR